MARIPKCLTLENIYRINKITGKIVRVFVIGFLISVSGRTLIAKDTANIVSIYA